jgi:hypothetical protein
MKFFAFILSFYVLVLTAMPCIDVHQDNVTHKTEVSQNSQNTHHHSDADNCSPFCTCNCCATSVIFQEHRIQLTCFSFSENQYLNSASGHFFSPFYSIWQPPKIA